MSSTQEILWTPQPRQARALECPAFELFFGGAAGGGKSDFLLLDFLRGTDYGAAHSGIIFRKSYKELEELQKRAVELYKPLGAEYRATTRTWIFPDPNTPGEPGATLKFRHLESEQDVHDYQGHQYTWVGFDELTNWPSDYCYVYLMSRIRSPKGIPCRIRAAGNPGGVGHAWVKDRFIDPAPPDYVWEAKVKMNGREMKTTRCFIPSKLEDNLILMKMDPGYEDRMAMLPPHLYRALREGDWTVFAGQVFEEFRVDTHVVKPFALDPDWHKFAAMDWGFAKPFSIGWWTVTNTSRMIRYDELYGCEKRPTGEDDPDKGVRRDAYDIACEAFERSAPQGVVDMVADPACWHKMGLGNSIAEAFERAGWRLTKANNERVNGLQTMHERMKLKDADGLPMLLVFENCRSFIRTIPMLVYDERHPEDVDTTGEDHIYDESRYACMSPHAQLSITERRLHRATMNIDYRSRNGERLLDWV